MAMASTPGKTQVEATAKGPAASAAGPQLALPEKRGGVMRSGSLQRAAAHPPPDGATALLMEPGLGGAGRARAMRAMQGGMGNARISRMLDTSAPRVQRACACGGEAGQDGECAECKAKRQAIQRQALGPTGGNTVPASVTTALQSSGGQP